MRFHVVLYVCCGAVASGFLQNSPLHPPIQVFRTDSGVGENKVLLERLLADSKEKLVSSTGLWMAFDCKDSKSTNMFDGPLALTKERDACGVGFIANTQSGGKH